MILLFVDYSVSRAVAVITVNVKQWPANGEGIHYLFRPGLRQTNKFCTQPAFELQLIYLKIGQNNLKK